VAHTDQATTPAAPTAETRQVGADCRLRLCGGAIQDPGDPYEEFPIGTIRSSRERSARRPRHFPQPDSLSAPSL